MKKQSCILVLLLSFVFCQNIVPDTSQMSVTEKMLYYQSVKKSPASAVLYSFIIPGAGHVYAESWKKGLIFGTIRLGSIIGGAIFLEEDIDITYIIWGVGGVFSLWEYIDVLVTTNKYNKQLHKEIFGTKHNLEISFTPQPKGIGLGLSYNF